MINFSKIIISDNNILENKKNIFKKSFNKIKDNVEKKGKIIVVTDFDFTLFNKYNYSTDKNMKVLSVCIIKTFLEETKKILKRKE